MQKTIELDVASGQRLLPLISDCLPSYSSPVLDIVPCLHRFRPLVRRLSTLIAASCPKLDPEA